MVKGEFRTNVAEGGRNAVTWGVFPGQEVAQSTIIEKESFLAWKVCAVLYALVQELMVSPACRRRPSLSGQSGHRSIPRVLRNGDCSTGYAANGGSSALCTMITKTLTPCGTSCLTRESLSSESFPKPNSRM